MQADDGTAAERTTTDAGEAELGALLRRAGAIAGRGGAMRLVLMRLCRRRPEDRAALEVAAEVFGPDPDG
jgi:hypothetical protein